MTESSLEEMQYVKELYKKTDGRQYIHLIQSFSPEDNVTREHMHNHLVINSVNFENGKKIQMSKKDLQNIKDFSDSLCKEVGLPIIEKSDK